MRSRGKLLCMLLVVGWLGVALASAAQNPVAQNNRAVELLRDGEFQEGIALLRKIAASLPHDPLVQQNLHQAYLAAGRALYQQRRYVELAELMSKAQEFSDGERDFWRFRGVALLRLKQYFTAENDLQQARAMGQPDAAILFWLGELYYATDRMYEALDMLESAQLHAPEDRSIAEMLTKVRRELAVEKEMDKTYGGHFVITYDGQQNAALGADVLAVLEEAYNDIGAWLMHYPQLQVPVILYSRQQFSELTRSPHWVAGLYDGKIRIPVGGVARVDDRIKALLYHEYMHVVLRDIAGDNLPLWLNEGMAEAAESKYVEPNLQRLLAAQAQGTLFHLQDLEASLRDFSATQVALAYQQSYAVVNTLIEEYGWHYLRDLVDALAEGSSIEQAFGQAFAVFGLSYSEFKKHWHEALEVTP